MNKLLLVSLLMVSVLGIMAQDPNTEVGVAGPVGESPVNQGSTGTNTGEQLSQPSNTDSSSSSSSSEEEEKRRPKEGGNRAGRHMGARRRGAMNGNGDNEEFGDDRNGDGNDEENRGRNRMDGESSRNRRNGGRGGSNWRRRGPGGRDQQNDATSSEGN